MTQDILHSHMACVRANGIEIVYDTFGDMFAPPLLLIADLGEQLIAWDEEFCVQLAAQGYWVIRYDNRDTGLSTRFDHISVPDIATLYQSTALGKGGPAAYTLRDMADDALGLLDALEISSAHVVGASMGGMIAQILAVHDPVRVRTLTSIMSTTSDPNLPLPKPEALAILFTPSPTNLMGHIDHSLHAARILCGPAFPMDPDRVGKLAEQAFGRGLNPAGTARQFAAITASGNRKDALKAIRVPMLVIHGDADPVFPIQCGIATARAAVGAKMLVIDGLGHHLPPAVYPTLIDAIGCHAL